MKVESEREVAQSCPTPSDLMDCSPPGSSVHGIFQARVLDWGAIAFSILQSSVGEILIEMISRKKKVKWKSMGVDNQMNFCFCFV